jgi:hypothetical protein
MKNLQSVFAMVLIAFFVMSCGIVQRFMPGGNEGLSRTNALWPDVPKMDGLAASDLEMPFMVKLFMRTMLNNLYRLNKEGEDKTPVEGDWIVFSTSSSPADVQQFYTNERMTSFGNWEPSKNSTCFDGSDKGYPGIACVFEKIADGKQIELLILAGHDDEKKTTNVFYLRLEGPIDKDRKISRTAEKPGNDAIKKLDGKAPYGIESRPLPTGTDLDVLLPKQVGPYSRVILERSEQRGTTPTSIEVDGNSVYATYKNGEKEVFIELSIASSPEIAQSNWDVVVGDANEGTYPTDPQFGSFRTEPSYLKVVNSDGAFFAWTRGPYFITANAKGGESDLAAFMNAFSY